MINMTLKERKIAASSLLFGIAVGDALGVPVEFQPRGSFQVNGMRGHGTHNQPPGTWSDDTSLTLCLVDSLSRGFSLDDIARNFIQ
jgi:ADP-ribosylglycohydrolase